ncbi:MULTISPECIES: 16S rRNA (cytidine(1402)-2'-O)-methyltransferase [Gammaproteobacteria]|uniref:16S rRNA (cytidine(1402)-2'-O)-methyltransferase n=1 Tax=Gammaproteobacteria TaxID=1236 RepID=UPI000DCFCF70|nr:MULTISPECIES: 16S rRNA (cytidine(1402)-2'-O)-methyltransferase [Gammaproteobacteria]RTE86326.1 16S rRNA (cytidine(1402)-2'-O)-methyltransferase [Aliidiomarina sp. B3213]TCZ91676.1 16S rRNA (cytidine(1402)-2'-O)-methyltransferase [Lysobacter sp. N42]
MTAGILYIVPTPIGNLEDMSSRALRVLEEVDAIAAEDTRHSKTLLSHFGITTPLFAVHEHNERQKVDSVVAKLLEGQSIALISDAGTPLISDPGFPLVRGCREHNIQVVSLPGPCAAVVALAGSGLPTDQFKFCGFLPAKSGARKKVLKNYAEATETLVFYEAPRRILDCLADISEVLGDEREIVLGRELTKQFETFLSGTAQQLAEKIEKDPNQQKGEMVLMIAGQSPQKDDIPQEAIRLLEALRAELPPKKAAKIVAQHYDLSANELYKLNL